MAEPLQIWVRNEKGKVWGPVMPATLELLFDHALIPGKVQISLDGMNYVYPSVLPEVRNSVPRELWGVGGPPDEAPVVAAPRAAPSSAPGGPPKLGTAPPGGPVSTVPGGPVRAPGNPVSSVPGGPVRPPGNPVSTVPGAPIRSGPGAPMAGPGAVAQASARNATSSSIPGVRLAQDRRTLSADIGAPVAAAAPAPPPASAPKPNAPAPAPVAAVILPTADIPPRGSLETTSALRLYYLAGSSDATGLLTITLSDRTVSIHFRKGNPEFVDGTHAEDQLTTFLVKNQLATFEQLGKAEQEKAKFGGELIGALFGTGLLNPATAFQHLAQRAASILVRGLFAETGTFTWELKDLPPHKAMPLGQRWAVVSEQVRKLPGTDLKRRLADALNLPVMKSGGVVPVSELRLTPQETRALSYFDGVRSINQLMHDLPNDSDHILRVAFLLNQMESVSFAAVAVPPPPSGPPSVAAGPAVIAAAPPIAMAPPVAVPPTPAVAAAAPARPGAPSSGPRPPPPKITTSPGAPAVPRAAPVMTPPSGRVAAAPAPVPSTATPPPVDTATEIKQLLALVDKMKKQNHFELLGLTEKADAAAVKIAYFKFARLYHPDTVPPNAPEQLAKLKAEVFGRVGDANRTLSDDKLRAEYLEEVKGGTAGEKVDIAQILAAEEMFRKGEILVKAKKFPEAVKMLDDAIKNADEAEYFAFRGFAKFFTFPDKKAGLVEAMKDINICLKKNPRVASAWYFQGQMNKLLGDLAAAKKQFQTCLQHNPQHLDAQRELRMIK